MADRATREVARFQSWNHHTLQHAVDMIANQADLVPDTPRTWFQLALVLHESGLLIGDCGMHFRQDDHRQVELGITLGSAYRGQGFAAEALRIILDLMFGSLNKNRVSAITHAENHSGVNLFARLEFRREGHFVEYV